ncbi:EpsG family protein [Polaribacter litorisediminis]|uniref:EpsG family protein n=1 Tax=Polaribacter litorisediminis TaxID=1908341 RepID=UPI001CBFDFC6|nr:EpsG family protein [Polaribacter litorisediminis]UAM96624.1 EpsG family protein [Polaribacter litorisediminis]
MFISPVILLIAAFRQSNRNLKKWVLIIFITFFGSLIFLSPGTDGYVHRKNVSEHYIGLGFGQFLEEIGRQLTFQQTPGVQDEPFIHILSFVVGALRVPGLFFTLVAFIFAYFYVGSLFRLFEIYPTWKRSKVFFLYALVFVLFMGVQQINQIRTGVGFWVLFYACLSYYQTKKIKYLLLMFVPPFIHIGYWAMALPAWGVLILGNWKWIYSVIFFLSFTSQLVNPSTVTNQMEKTEIGKSKVKGYSVEEKATSEQVLKAYGNTNWYKKYAKLGLQVWGVNVIAIILIIFGTYFSGMNKLESRLFSTGILTVSLSNLSWFLYALKNRSAAVGMVFILATLLLLWQRGYFNSSINKVKNQLFAIRVLITLFIFVIIFNVSELIQLLSIFLFFAPFIPWIVEEMNVSIRGFIGLIGGF